MEARASQAADRPLKRAPLCAEIAVTAADARQIIRVLAQIGGQRAHRLVEWSSADADADAEGESDAPAASDLPPLYYAALLSDDALDDMPLGLGDTPTDALVDLLWALGDPLLRATLRADDPEPAHVAETIAARVPAQPE